MTQLEMARMGKVSPEMELAAGAENMSAEEIRLNICASPMQTMCEPE